MIHTLESEQWVPRPLEEVFAFFSNPKNLEILTPPFLKFRIVAMPMKMAAGALIQYKITVRALPIRWKTEIKTWDPPNGFSDVQLSGPYKLWDHTHGFQAVDGGTRLTDHVRYELPFGFLGEMVHSLWVKNDVEKIFAFRREKIQDLFGTPAAK